MTTFPHVEDYLEYLAGYNNGPANLITAPDMDRIRLARYDVRIVDSMANSTMFGTALTDKQSVLTLKLIVKYRRQFAKNGIDVDPVLKPIWRMKPRYVDRAREIFLDGKQIVIKFPYDNKLIDEVQMYRDRSKGRVYFERDSKQWRLALTEPNIEWAVEWARSKGKETFIIDPAITQVLNTILECKKIPYEIKLVQQDQSYQITNGPPSLIEFLDSKGGMTKDNLINLVDYSGLCGYTLSEEVSRECLQRYPQALLAIGQHYRIHIDPSPSNLQMIWDYAEITNRYPICIYNPTLFEIDLSPFDEKDIVRFDRNGKTKTCDYNPYDVKLIYAQKIPETWNFPVPLMITTFEMMFGARKKDWSLRAEKIIYYGTTSLLTDKYGNS